MPTAKEKALHFVENETAFHLGELLTEKSHPKTLSLSQTIRHDMDSGIRMLLSVDEDVSALAKRIFKTKEFIDLTDSIYQALIHKRHICFSGCGSTGRLSILLDAMWRGFWENTERKHPSIYTKFCDISEATVSIMTGGDRALIKSVENFEDYQEFGRQQVREAGITAGDVFIAITEGGETLSVIGSAWQALENKAEVFFVYNNPTQPLAKYVERSRLIIEEDRITKLDLSTGPMAIAGSTRMQATTAELLVIGAALESALLKILENRLSAAEMKELGINTLSFDYYRNFDGLLTELKKPSSVKAIGNAVLLEEKVYSNKGLVTYIADSFLLDVFTDTTERAPTFMLPSFRKRDDGISPSSWAFAKNPLYMTEKAWLNMLKRGLKGLNWTPDTYKKLNAPAGIYSDPPKLDNSEILKYQIGKEEDTSRYKAPDSALIAVLAGTEIEEKIVSNSLFMSYLTNHSKNYKRQAAIIIGPKKTNFDYGQIFHVDCALPASLLCLWTHLAVKLVFNTISTATMVRLGRVEKNWMVYVETTNKKLIDRSTRLISEFTGLNYRDSCIALFETLEEIEKTKGQGKEISSAVITTIQKIKGN